VEKIGTRLFKIAIRSNVGNMNEKRAEALSGQFTEKFEVRILQEQPIGKAFVLANPSKREVILIEQGSITYQIESETDINVDFEKINEYLSTIFTTLLLDEQCEGLVHIMGNIKAKTLNSMDESINIFVKEQTSNIIPNLKGAGIRFLINHETGIWEYKVEPFINNSEFFFLEMICNITQQLSISDIVGIAGSSFVDFRENKTGVLESLGIS
jgi:hypothetical protein